MSLVYKLSEVLNVLIIVLLLKSCHASFLLSRDCERCFSCGSEVSARATYQQAFERSRSQEYAYHNARHGRVSTRLIPQFPGRLNEYFPVPIIPRLTALLLKGLWSFIHNLAHASGKAGQQR